ncbi:MAG: peptidylprolyl isomerase [Bacteriovoracaceae bacterium]
MEVKKLVVLAGLLLSFSLFAAPKGTVVVFKTNMGTFEAELFDDKAPKTVKNFLRYVDKGFFNGTIYHRVIKNFMIQGGGFDENLGRKKGEAPIKNEADNRLKNDKGTLAMARTQDPHSASSQFFINVKDNDFLNFKGKLPGAWGYAVFGKVIKGMDVVMKISQTPTGVKKGMRDVPNNSVIMEKVARKGKAIKNKTNR